MSRPNKSIGKTINDYTIIGRCTDNPKYYIAKCNICGRERITTPYNLSRVAWSKHENCVGKVRKIDISKRRKPRRQVTFEGDIIQKDKNDLQELYKESNLSVGKKYYLLTDHFYPDHFTDYRLMVCIAKYPNFADFKDVKTGVEHSFRYWDLCHGNLLKRV